jgi:hypothetical protein
MKITPEKRKQLLSWTWKIALVIAAIVTFNVVSVKLATKDKDEIAASGHQSGPAVQPPPGPAIPPAYSLLANDREDPGPAAESANQLVPGGDGYDILCVWNGPTPQGMSAQTFRWNPKTGNGEWTCVITQRVLGVKTGTIPMSGRLVVGQDPTTGVLKFVMYENDLSDLSTETVKVSGILRPRWTQVES